MIDPFRNLRDIQRMLNDLRPAFEQLEQAQRQIQASSLVLNVRDIVQEFERNRPALLAAADYARQQQAMLAAIRPFAIESIQASLVVDASSLRSYLTQLNLALDNSRLIGQVQLGDASADDEEGNRVTIEEQLVEIVPAATLAKIKRIDFAPFTLLDRVLREPELMRRLHSREFELFAAALVEHLGFEDVILTPSSGDGGRDVIATQRIHGLELIFAFECKKYASNNPVGPDIARALLGTISHGATRATQGVILTTSYFTPAARQFILTEPTLDGRDFDGLVDWLRQPHQRRRGEAT